ncbi:MAG TPA: prephenate dehydrogenase [Anaerolineae bacterium]|nr:prephenate dehydrogenase [Anaerolineae bacterium]
MNMDIFFIGLDQIGASIGMALANSELEVRRTGYDPDDKLTRNAHQLGAVDQVVPHPMKASEIADVVVIATPSIDVRDYLEMLGEKLKAGAMVLDTSPFKAQHATWASELLPEERHYIGAMPIVGPEALFTEAPDPRTPRADLFQGGLLAMVVPPKTSEEAVTLALNLASAIGTTPFFLDPLENDAVIATVEGLPYLMASAFMQMATRAHNWREIQRIGGMPFVHATSIDPSQPSKTQANTLHLNRDVVINKLDEFTEELRRLRDLIAREDHKALYEYLDEADKARDSWLAIRQSGDWASQDLLPTERIERPGFLSGALGLRSRRPKKRP